MSAINRAHATGVLVAYRDGDIPVDVALDRLEECIDGAGDDWDLYAHEREQRGDDA